MQILQELGAANGPLCVGLDTDPSYIPQSVLINYPSPAQAVLAYNKEIIKRVREAQSACCFKVQIAYYEAMGRAEMKLDDIVENGAWGLFEYDQVQHAIDEAVNHLSESIRDGSLISKHLYVV